MSSRIFTPLAVVLALLLALSVVSMAACNGKCSAKQSAPAQKIKVLFEVGGGVHNEKECPELMKKVLEDTKQFDVLVTQDRDQFKAENLKKYDAVMIYTTGGELSKDQEQGLVKFVEDGGALVGIHCATDSFKNSDAYWKLMCGRFIGHGHETFGVHITAKRHPIVQGMSDFEINDETYRHNWFPESKPIVLMRRVTDSDPSAWVQYVGKGRVFTTGLGHDMAAWDNPAFKQMIERALLWSVGRLNP